MTTNEPCHCEEQYRICVAATWQSRRLLICARRFLRRAMPAHLPLAFTVMVLLILPLVSSAQTQYFDYNYVPAIRSVEFYNIAKEGSFPQFNLGQKEQLQLAFDDLRGGNRNYYYTIEHCDENWNPSNIPTPEYLQGFTEDRIIDYLYSSGTNQKYTHYEIKLPNDNIVPKISGNYVVKVYEDQDPTKLVFIRKFYVVNSKLSVVASIVPSNFARATNQKVNFQVNYGNLPVQNPSGDLKIFIMQNGRPETGMANVQPTSIRGNQLIFDDPSINDFPGRNEFRHVDIRSLKLNSDRVGHIYHDTAYTVMLLPDFTRNLPNYTFLYDSNGAFFILNSDGAGDPKRDADYAHLYFTFATTKTPADGSPYIVGKFNNYTLDEHSKLAYEPVKGRFIADLFLKQGVYDYQYIWVDAKTGVPDNIALEGSYYDTENDYQLLVYYRPANARWTELVGYRELNNTSGNNTKKR